MAKAHPPPVWHIPACNEPAKRGTFAKPLLNLFDIMNVALWLISTRAERRVSAVPEDYNHYEDDFVDYPELESATG